ncbi:MAG: hypothetical protein M0P95_07745 [Sulfuritalea sp.]|nr:hypothetical protein [Sulfuritalea sp.]
MKNYKLSLAETVPGTFILYIQSNEQIVQQCIKSCAPSRERNPSVLHRAGAMSRSGGEWAPALC